MEIQAVLDVVQEMYAPTYLQNAYRRWNFLAHLRNCTLLPAENYLLTASNTVQFVMAQALITQIVLSVMQRIGDISCTRVIITVQITVLQALQILSRFATILIRGTYSLGPLHPTRG